MEKARQFRIRGAGVEVMRACANGQAVCLIRSSLP